MADEDGTKKVAVLLMALGEEIAAQILSHMGPKAVQAVGTAMSELDSVPKEFVADTLNQFIQEIQRETGLGVGSDDYVRNVLVSALGEDKAGGMLDRILMGGNTKGLESLKWMDSKSVADLIRNEHPQIIAVVLSYLDSDQSASILSEFDDRVRSDVLMRIAGVEGILPIAVKELNDILEAQLKGGSNAKASGLGGVKAAANILNFVEGSTSATIMEMVREADEELCTEIEDLMFVFADLIEVDDRGIQTILRDVQTDELVLALKGADTELQEKVFANMSSRAADMLKDDLETSGPVKLSEVEEAQKKVLVVARRLADEGQISLGASGGGEEMVG